MIEIDTFIYDTIRPVTWHDNGLRLLDQRQLPEQEVYLHINSTQALHEAIKNMAVRGAPAIGIAAAYGAVLATKEASSDQSKGFAESFNSRLNLLASSRPTAVNLFNALNAAKQVLDPINNLLSWANSWFEADIIANKKMSVQAAQYLTEPVNVLTHCNAGALATGGYGTALGVIRTGFQMGLIGAIYAGETRPWNQGARLTLWEFQKDNIPVTLTADSAVASMMKKGLIDWVIVGADSICLNGDVAIKIGTYSLAVLAKHHGVKLMVVAPTTTLDLNAKSADDIVIEQRSTDEILPTVYKKELVDALNPAFDLTPAELISVIVTEKGVIESPDASKMKALINHS
jgi:methylthioribose-1-phosphate isomerase